MTDIDRQIESLGYEIRVSDLSCCYIVYENKKQDQEIIIEWEDDDIPVECCRIFSQTITRVKDWLGHMNQIPQALTIQEAEIFVAKIKELRKGSFFFANFTATIMTKYFKGGIRMITLAILLLLGLALIIFTIISVVVVGSVGFVIFGDIIVAILIIAWIIRCVAKK